MARISGRGAARRTASALLLVALSATGAQAHGFSGTVSYRGGLGPVNFQRPLCLCVFTDPQLRDSLGCLIFRFNDATFNLDLGDGTFYLIAFLDLQINEQRDPGEPFEIFADRGSTPADPLVTNDVPRSDVDFDFGEEHLSATPTATAAATATPSATRSATPTGTFTPSHTPTRTHTPTATVPAPTRTPTPTCALPDDPACACIGDCNGNGLVAVNELITVVRIALGVSDVALCAAGDANRDGTAQIGELVAAVRRSLSGC